MKKQKLKKMNKAIKKDNLELREQKLALMSENDQLRSDIFILRSKCRDFEKACFDTTVSNLCLKKILADKENEKVGSVSIVNVEWNGDTTTVFWSDGIETKVTRQKGEKYDKQSAIAYAIAKRVLGKSSVADVVEKFSEEGKKDARYERVYKALQSKSYKNRLDAQKEWEKIPESKRQSIKAKIKNK